MKQSSKLKRVILAVDLKALEPKLVQQIWAALTPLLKSEDVVVEPVTVLNREDAAMGNYFKNKIGALRAATERHLGERLSELGLKQLAPPKVLFADGSSKNRAVLALLNHAKKSECDLIALSSHSRKGMKRLFLGSFAETLSLQSHIPLLIVNTAQKPVSASSKTILFPTDFSDASKQGLQTVCETFQGKNRKIILFHNFNWPAQIYMEPFASYPLPQSAVDEEVRKTEKLGKQWCKEVQEKGLSCKFVLDRKSGFALDGVLKAIKKEKPSLVAMISNSGKLKSAILGSLTREVLRSSPRPMWVIRPQKEVAQRKAVRPIPSQSHFAKNGRVAAASR